MRKIAEIKARFREQQATAPYITSLAPKLEAKIRQIRDLRSLSEEGSKVEVAPAGEPIKGKGKKKKKKKPQVLEVVEE